MCVPDKYEIKEGEYNSLETSFNNENYGDSKLIFKEITKEEYESYNENVFIGQYNNQYIYIELFVYLKDEERFNQINIEYLTYDRRSDYKGICNFMLDDQLIRSYITIKADGELIINIHHLKLTYKY